jgi:predicted DNA-binding transcriptional regulator AlpA
VIEEQQKTQLLKAEEIATMLGLKVQTVYAMARRGELEKVKLSRRCLRLVEKQTPSRMHLSLDESFNFTCTALQEWWDGKNHHRINR